MTPEKIEFIKQWLFRASEDLAVIESLFHTKSHNFNSSICFHSQQAVEKSLTEFAVNIRYPDDFYIPDLKEAKYYRSVAIEISEIVLRQIGDRL